MQFEKLLFVITPNTDHETLTQAVQLCKNFKSKLFVLFIVESHRISRLASLTHQQTNTLHKKIEEQGWELLYTVEDEAVEIGVWTSLHLEEGNAMHIIKKYVDMYNINIILVERNDEAKKIFVSSPIPVIGL
jgi:sensor histidine kinase regulating citrate/malate metabolism